MAKSAIGKALEKANEKAISGAAKLRLESSLAFGGGGDDVHVFSMDNGLRVLVLVDRERAGRQLLHLVPRRLAPRKAGENRPRAPLRAPDVQRDRAPQSGRVRSQARGERRRDQRGDLARLDLLLRGRSRRIASARRSSSRPSAWRGSSCATPQVASEKEVVANERRYRVDDDVEGLASEILYRTAFERHTYGWPTIGWMEDILGFMPEDCEAFYETYYAPNNATIVVVGDVREADLLARIRNAYGVLPRAQLPEEDTQPEPPQHEERDVALRKPTATREARRRLPRPGARRCRITRRSPCSRDPVRRARVARAPRDAHRPGDRDEICAGGSRRSATRASSRCI